MRLNYCAYWRLPRILTVAIEDYRSANVLFIKPTRAAHQLAPLFVVGLQLRYYRGIGQRGGVAQGFAFRDVLQ